MRVVGEVMRSLSASRERLAIDVFIEERCRELGLNRGALAQRLGFKNAKKALRRLHELCEGELVRTAAVIRALPGALDVPAEVIAKVIDRTGSRLGALEAGSSSESPQIPFTARFARAFEYATVYHQWQTRPGTRIPYISHLIAVASLVLEHGADEDTAIAALLHDTPEDRVPVSVLSSIQLRFGRRVAAIVQGCCRTNPYEGMKEAPWPERMEWYIAQLERADQAVCLVAAADELDNVRAIMQHLRNVGSAVFYRFSSLRLAAAADELDNRRAILQRLWKVGNAVFYRCSASREQTGWHYGAIADVLHRRLAGSQALPIAVALRHAVHEIAGLSGAERFAAGAALAKRGERCPVEVRHA